MSIAEYHRKHYIDSIARSVCFYPRSLGCPASGSRHSRQCQGWALSYGKGLKLNHLLIVNAQKFCVSYAPSHLTGRTNCRLKVMRLGLCSNPSSGSLVKIQREPFQIPYPPCLSSLRMPESTKRSDSSSDCSQLFLITFNSLS